ncbi:interferon regulatory factor 10 [Lampris incognitus]|uniref:interferon regulatory factor 10 n=1 Tax=Lampris incognitus TaxID=2546036 RepID=UPI0024B4A7E4|nr:interferon regulatory factor 10 [Lampris incognitus]
MKMEEEAKMRLRDWLIAQIDSDRYEGLSWENADKTLFRIPWKHAAKKDYNQNEDAALFKAWAVYKGKYREGRDKADPTMWKTRLRCALNKSTDFAEVPEKSRLDISEPYKVYCICPDVNPVIPTELLQNESQMKVQVRRPSSPPKNPLLPYPQLHCQWEPSEGMQEPRNMNEALLREHMYCEFGKGKPRSSAPLVHPSLTNSISDFRMQVRLFYQGQVVTDVNTSSPDGCFILQGSFTLGNEKIYGPCSAQQLSFPMPELVPLQPGIADTMGSLLSHLERGVLLWVAPDGVFIKRFCRGRVYWSGPMAEHTDKPNKLDRERTFKLLDMPIFLNEVQQFRHRMGPPPRYKIELCFGEEFPDLSMPKTQKLILVEVVPLFAVELLQSSHMGETVEKQHAHTLNTKKEAM